MHMLHAWPSMHRAKDSACTVDVPCQCRGVGFDAGQIPAL